MVRPGKASQDEEYNDGTDLSSSFSVRTSQFANPDTSCGNPHLLQGFTARGTTATGACLTPPAFPDRQTG